MRSTSTKVVAAGILLAALLLAGIVSFYADSDPDGLTRVSQDKGFASTEKDHATADGPFAGYGASFISDERLSGGFAGVVGVLVVLVAAGGLTMVVRRRGGSSRSDGSTESPSQQV